MCACVVRHCNRPIEIHTNRRQLGTTTAGIVVCTPIWCTTITADKCTATAAGGIGIGRYWWCWWLGYGRHFRYFSVGIAHVEYHGRRCYACDEQCSAGSVLVCLPFFSVGSAFGRWAQLVKYFCWSCPTSLFAKFVQLHDGRCCTSQLFKCSCKCCATIGIPISATLDAELTQLHDGRHCRCRQQCERQRSVFVGIGIDRLIEWQRSAATTDGITHVVNGTDAQSNDATSTRYVMVTVCGTLFHVCSN